MSFTVYPMTRTLNLLTFDTQDTEHHPAFNVLIAYEDLETGKRAKKTYDFLVENLGTGHQFTNQMWKFDVLAIPHLRELAAKDCAKANLIMVSCHGGKLPAEVQAWIELWLTEPHQPFALVAMFDPDIDSSETQNYLAGVAKRGQMEFFAQPTHVLLNKQLTPFQANTRSAVGDLVSFAASEERERSAPRWGINE